jgi:hypothetical protein
VTTDELVEAVKRAGGVLELRGESVRCTLPRCVVHLADRLRECKPELIATLQGRGGRVATFPHCPRCASYDLYRKNNVGKYECETCGLEQIEEHEARRVM